MHGRGHTHHSALGELRTAHPRPTRHVALRVARLAQRRAAGLSQCGSARGAFAQAWTGDRGRETRHRRARRSGLVGVSSPLAALRRRLLAPGQEELSARKYRRFAIRWLSGRTQTGSVAIGRRSSVEIFHRATQPNLNGFGQQADPVLCVRDFELEQKPSDEGDRQKTRYRDRR